MLVKTKQTADFIRQKTQDFQPEIGVILGSGLGGFVDALETQYSLDYASIPNFPLSTVHGHSGKLVFGMMHGKRVVAMQGRFHFYEGYPMNEVCFPVYVMKAIGVKSVLVSNASGGMNPSYKVGDIVLIKDHINLFGTNPLIGKNDDELGPRFPSLHNAYDKKILQQASAIADRLNIHHQVGVYAGVTGPSYETNAEYIYLRTIGADIVGMSTVPEVIVANYLGLKVFGISIVSDMGGGAVAEEVSHEQVLEAVGLSTPKLMQLVTTLVGEL